MKVNIKKLTNNQIDNIIEIQTDVELVNAMGFKFAIPLIEGDVLEIKYYGEHKEEEKPKAPIGLKSAKYCNNMNKFAA